ncbi:hypothetical protein C8D97_1031, partial [Pleionea mediterranea]
MNTSQIARVNNDEVLVADIYPAFHLTDL